MNTSKLMLTAIFSCFMLYTSASAAIDLVGSYQSALSYNADYLKAIAQNQASQELQTQGKSLLLPQISLSAAMTENYLNSGMTVYYHQPTLTAQLQQVIFDFGKFSTYTKATFATELSDLQLELAKEQLMLNVSQAYLDVLYANDSLTAIKITKQAMQQELAQANAAFTAGTVTIADVNDASSGFDTASANEIQAQNDLLNRKTIFYNLTGLNADLIQPLQNEIILVQPTPDNPESWVAFARSANTNVKIAGKQVAMSLEDIKIAKSGHSPTINFVGNYQYAGTPSIDSTDSAATTAALNQGAGTLGSFLSSYGLATVGLQVSVPIYSGGGISSKVRQNMNNYENAMEQLEAIKRQSSVDIQNALWQVKNGVSLVIAQTQALKSAKLKLESDKMGYKAGIRNSINVINSEKSYYSAMQNYNQARYQYLSNKLQLEYLAGKINEEFLTLLNINIAK